MHTLIFIMISLGTKNPEMTMIDSFQGNNWYIGQKERTWLKFVTISCVKSLVRIRILPPFSYDHYEKMKIGKQLTKRIAKEERLKSLEAR